MKFINLHKILDWKALSENVETPEEREEGVPSWLSGEGHIGFNGTKRQLDRIFSAMCHRCHTMQPLNHNCEIYDGEK